MGASLMETTTGQGRWVEVQRPWHDTAVTNCTLCGRLVPRHIWIVEFGGKALPFCNEECEGLYRSYWLPKYGGTGDGERKTEDG
jgi:hypothetical protein